MLLLNQKNEVKPRKVFQDFNSEIENPKIHLYFFFTNIAFFGG